jgi:hypothetical protein
MNNSFRSNSIREILTRAAATFWLVPSSLLLLQSASANDANKAAVQPATGVAKTVNAAEEARSRSRRHKTECCDGRTAGEYGDKYE